MKRSHYILFIILASLAFVYFGVSVNFLYQHRIGLSIISSLVIGSLLMYYLFIAFDKILGYELYVTRVLLAFSFIAGNIFLSQHYANGRIEKEFMYNSSLHFAMLYKEKVEGGQSGIETFISYPTKQWGNVQLHIFMLEKYYQLLPDTLSIPILYSKDHPRMKRILRSQKELVPLMARHNIRPKDLAYTRLASDDISRHENNFRLAMKSFDKTDKLLKERLGYEEDSVSFFKSRLPIPIYEKSKPSNPIAMGIISIAGGILTLMQLAVFFSRD